MKAIETGLRTRRGFLKEFALGSAAAVAAGRSIGAAAGAQAATNWQTQIGLELYTVRDLMAKDYEGTMSAQHYRGMLDRLGLTMPSTHSPARGTGAELERQLEGFQAMGIKYTEIAGGGGGAAGARGARAGRDGNPPLPSGADFDAGTGIIHNASHRAAAGRSRPCAWTCGSPSCRAFASTCPTRRSSSTSSTS